MEYGYLIWVIVFGIVWLTFFIFRKRLRRQMLFVSLLALPLELTEPYWLSQYYNPDSVLTFLNMYTTEATLWLFFSGGITAVIYEFVFRWRSVKCNFSQRRRKQALAVYFLMIAGMFFLYSIDTYTNMRIMDATIMGIVVAYIYMIIIRKKLFIPSIVAGVLFTIVTVVAIKVSDLFYPGYIFNQWYTENLWGVYLLNIPLEEYAFAFLFGAVFSILYEEVNSRCLVKDRGK